MTLPLYVLILALVIVGVILGGVAAWMRQGKWRGRARLAEAQAHELRAETSCSSGATLHVRPTAPRPRPCAAASHPAAGGVTGSPAVRV